MTDDLQAALQAAEERAERAEAQVAKAAALVQDGQSYHDVTRDHAKQLARADRYREALERIASGEHREASPSRIARAALTREDE